MFPILESPCASNYWTNSFVIHQWKNQVETFNVSSEQEALQFWRPIQTDSFQAYTCKSKTGCFGLLHLQHTSDRYICAICCSLHINDTNTCHRSIQCMSLSRSRVATVQNMQENSSTDLFITLEKVGKWMARCLRLMQLHARLFNDPELINLWLWGKVKLL